MDIEQSLELIGDYLQVKAVERFVEWKRSIIGYVGDVEIDKKRPLGHPVG